MGCPISSTPNVIKMENETYVIAPTTSGNIFFINYYESEIVERMDLPGEVFSSPAVDGKEMYIGCRDNYVYCIAIK